MDFKDLFSFSFIDSLICFQWQKSQKGQAISLIILINGLVKWDIHHRGKISHNSLAIKKNKQTLHYEPRWQVVMSLECSWRREEGGWHCALLHWEEGSVLWCSSSKDADSKCSKWSSSSITVWAFVTSKHFDTLFIL